MEFTAEQWAGLAEHSAERGLVFLSSPFSIPAVDLLERIGMPAWKVGSGEVSNRPMIERMARTGKPVLLVERAFGLGRARRCRRLGAGGGGRALPFFSVERHTLVRRKRSG